MSRRFVSCQSTTMDERWMTFDMLGDLLHTLRSVNDVTKGSTQEAHMCTSCVLPRKVGEMV